MGVALRRLAPPFVLLLLPATLASARAAIIPPAAPATVASPAAASESPLRTIGSVRATTPLCRELVGHASTAIDALLTGDARLVFLEQTLKTVDLDSSPMSKYAGNQKLTEEFVQLRAGALGGQREMDALRTAAKNADTPEQQAALKTFADALDGALVRQKRLADALGRFVAYVDTHASITNDERDAMIFNAVAAMNTLGYGGDTTTMDAFGATQTHVADMATNGDPMQFIPDPLSVTAKKASAEIARRAQPIASDEAAAAQRMDPAFSGC